jgi:hypothetical protein
MKLPNRHEAIVPKEKVADYLLSMAHPRGRDKARFFERFGFAASAWEALAVALRAHAAEHEVADQDDSPFGTWYTIEGELETPSGRRPLVRSVWFIDAGAAGPRFVTAYPLERRRL